MQNRIVESLPQIQRVCVVGEDDVYYRWSHDVSIARMSLAVD